MLYESRAMANFMGSLLIISKQYLNQTVCSWLTLRPAQPNKSSSAAHRHVRPTETMRPRRKVVSREFYVHTTGSTNSYLAICALCFIVEAFYVDLDREILLISPTGAPSFKQPTRLNDEIVP